MKLVIVTSVEQFHDDVYSLFKKAGIEQFSGSEIEGYQNITSAIAATRWFPGKSGGAESSLFFSFTQDTQAQDLFTLIKQYNKNMKTNNPLRAVIVPVEKFI
ncbi:hypothetical protein [Ascidiimonas aurantiaca]|uniref:hypothetical protein n=1 Tax=Ascidiimonas aurantiaca TaxID=1685432 RepID=UPI0030EF5B26